MMKLYIETLGCPKNFNDSEGAAGIWESRGMTVTEDPEEADVIMVNTCGFINDAKKESIDSIFEMVDYAEDRGKRGKKPMLVASGCLVQRYGDVLTEEMPEVDLFIGVNEYERLPELVAEYESGQKLHRGWCSDVFEEFSARRIRKGTYSSTLRIAEGCNNCCAYCVIPQIRGGYRSRPMERITAEAEKMAAAGIREIILIAQDVTEYGRDIYGRLMLPELLKSLCRIDGIHWIRLMYCYEDKITDELMEVMASEPKICHYIDIPLQHISDNVLRRMRRRSTTAGIKKKLCDLRVAVPDIHIRTTFITGFPGESEADIDELIDFAEEYRFERLGVFAYSQEEGTAAGDMEDQIDEDVRSARAESIMLRQVEISRQICEAKIGSVLEVLVEGRDEDGSFIGRTQYDAPEIDGAVLFRLPEGAAEPTPGDFVRVAVEDAFDYDLTGVMV